MNNPDKESYKFDLDRFHTYDLHNQDRINMINLIRYNFLRVESEDTASTVFNRKKFFRGLFACNFRNSASVALSLKNDFLLGDIERLRTR